MSFSRKEIFKELRDYLVIGVGMISYCIGWNMFLLPNHIGTGGIAGVSSLLFWGLHIPVQASYFAINALLLMAAFRTLGLKFCIKTVYAVITVTAGVAYMSENVHVGLLGDQPFMAAIIGGLFCGAGVGLGLAAHGSTGGTDIIAAIVNKYRDISLARVIMLCDVVIISCSYFVLNDIEKVIYGYVVLYVTAFGIDQVVNATRRSVQFFIISEKWEEIGHRINTELHRGCTIVQGAGFYSGNETKILFVLANKRQSGFVFSLINEIDPNAFVSQSAVIGVYGRGFDHIKAKKLDKEHKENEKLKIKN